MNHQAIYNTHPQVKLIIDNDDGTVTCYDEHDVVVNINTDLVTPEATKLETEYQSNQYKRDRAKEYPDFRDYLDGIVKGDQAQIDKYIADCQAVKTKYPKGE